MASSTMFLLVRCFLSFSLLLLLLCLSPLQLGTAHEVHHHLHHNSNHHIVQISSLLQQDGCKPSPTGRRDGASLQVVHSHGPCSELINSAGDLRRPPSHEEILQRDQDRVNSIQARRAAAAAHSDWSRTSNSANLPAKSGISIGSANYVVIVGLGTPKKDLSLEFDTASDLTWTQCKPCPTKCYTQVDPLFDPSASSSYANISCTSATCTNAAAATSVKPGCSSSTCVYRISYGDMSFTMGFLASEMLTFTSTESLNNFIFGCGNDNEGLFGGSAGLLGLGGGNFSVVSQAAPKYGKYFSYCLSTSSTANGHLTLGKGGTKATNFTYTPLLTSSDTPTFYFVDLQAISVAGQTLPIPPATFTSTGTIMDSGTVISRLAPRAYEVLRNTFRSYMSRHGYPSAPAFTIFDTCYDLSKFDSVDVPKVALIFKGPAMIDLDVLGILFAVNASQVCLAFAGNSDSSGYSIIGNVQQQTFDIVYDVDGCKIGFGANGC